MGNRVSDLVITPHTGFIDLTGLNQINFNLTRVDGGYPVVLGLVLEDDDASHSVQLELPVITTDQALGYSAFVNPSSLPLGTFNLSRTTRIRIRAQHPGDTETRTGTFRLAFRGVIVGSSLGSSPAQTIAPDRTSLVDMISAIGGFVPSMDDLLRREPGESRGAESEFLGLLLDRVETHGNTAVASSAVAAVQNQGLAVMLGRHLNVRRKVRVEA